MDSPTVVFDVPLVDDSDDQLPPLVDDDDDETSNGDDDVVEFPDVVNVDEAEIAYWSFVSGNCHPCKPSLFKRFILLFNRSCASCAKRKQL